MCTVLRDIVVLSNSSRNCTLPSKSNFLKGLGTSARFQQPRRHNILYPLSFPVSLFLIYRNTLGSDDKSLQKLSLRAWQPAL